MCEELVNFKEVDYDSDDKLLLAMKEVGNKEK